MDTSPDPSTFESNNVDEAFQIWTSSRTKLAQAMKEYQVSSVELNKAVSLATHDTGSYRAIDQALAGIDLELDSLQSGEDQLVKTRAALSHARNTSQSLALIHRLPLETLTAIFISANRRCLRAREQSILRPSSPAFLLPTTLAAVCARWRRAAYSTPELWSHIDVIAGCHRKLSDLDWASLWASRAGSLPLDIDVWQYKENEFDAPPTPNPRYNKATIEFLTPLMGRVSELRLFVSSQSLLDILINCWAQNSSPTSPKSLHIMNRPLVLTHPVRMLPTEGSVEQFNNIFHTCHTLNVRRCEPFSRTLFHEQLLELRLEGLEYEGSFPSRLQLANALQAAPNLRTLVMTSISIIDPEGVPADSEPTPVVMNHLESLTMERFGLADSYTAMFKLLVVRSQSLHMSITLSDDDETIEAAHLFFGRTKVTKLHVGSSLHGEPLPLDEILCPMPYLEELAICHCRIREESLSLLTEAISHENAYAPWSRVHTFSLTYSPVDWTSLRDLVQINSIRSLHLYGVWIAGKQKPMSDHQRQKLEKRLKMVQDLKVDPDWSKSPSVNWSFIIMP